MTYIPNLLVYICHVPTVETVGTVVKDILSEHGNMWSEHGNVTRKANCVQANGYMQCLCMTLYIMPKFIMYVCRDGLVK